ncbi:hypothetical protein NKH77_23035 [Streptomyces sp. M19]
MEGPALTAVLCALVGCGLFLSMLNNGSVMTFSTMLALAAVGAGYWSHHRHLAESEGEVDPATAQAVADAPPEAQAPPARGMPSWWRDPVVKDGTTGHVGAESGYLWGPDDGTDRPPPGSAAGRRDRDGGHGPEAGHRETGRGRLAFGTFLLAALAGLGGARAAWHSHPLGTSLEIGLACALGVLGLGILVSGWFGRTGGGTVTLALLVSVALAGAALLPKSVTAEWARRTWTPTSASEVRPVTSWARAPPGCGWTGCRHRRRGGRCPATSRSAPDG